MAVFHCTMFLLSKKITVQRTALFIYVSFLWSFHHIKRALTGWNSVLHQRTDARFDDDKLIFKFLVPAKGQRERLKNQSDFATNTQHTPPLKRSIHEKVIQNCMILKSRRLTNLTRDWKFTILVTALASMSGDHSGTMKDLNIFFLKTSKMRLLIITPRIPDRSNILFTTAERTDWWFSPSSSLRSYQTVD